ncbi:helix-turn-helix transcriptional regulator [Clostridium sp. OS1-26]|uniref:helix-turn-helix domain-containing protein n=1 Tax=Clostridium sp. OS1-26 TaxID=3070681 RepID=UPI0027E16340|nr:helix-turn-helix transcriptional regulator [Clostridium sp. OS1-26]WML35670.1 helix-turn-helix transcriptional regulator [Clostridium sp. OS1-26]
MKINVEKINWIRIEQGLSLIELCERASVSRATISRLLKGEVSTRADIIGKIAMALEVPVKELYVKE